MAAFNRTSENGSIFGTTFEGSSVDGLYESLPKHKLMACPKPGGLLSEFENPYLDNIITGFLLAVAATLLGMLLFDAFFRSDGTTFRGDTIRALAARSRLRHGGPSVALDAKRRRWEVLPGTPGVEGHFCSRAMRKAILYSILASLLSVGSIVLGNSWARSLTVKSIPSVEMAVVNSESDPVAVHSSISEECDEFSYGYSGQFVKYRISYKRCVRYQFDLRGRDVAGFYPEPNAIAVQIRLSDSGACTVASGTEEYITAGYVRMVAATSDGGLTAAVLPANATSELSSAYGYIKRLAIWFIDDRAVLNSEGLSYRKTDRSALVNLNFRKVKSFSNASTSNLVQLLVELIHVRQVQGRPNQLFDLSLPMQPVRNFEAEKENLCTLQLKLVPYPILIIVCGVLAGLRLFLELWWPNKIWDGVWGVYRQTAAAASEDLPLPGATSVDLTKRKYSNGMQGHLGFRAPSESYDVVDMFEPNLRIV
jgi:hypothetical protein